MNASELVVLSAGPTLPVDVVRFALALEDRGCTLRVDGDRLLVGPKDKLTSEDRRTIVRWRESLLALAAYRAPAVH